MNAVSRTDIGSRKENQDRVKVAILNDNTAFAVVCDGMGGENAGGLASELAINMVYDRVTSGYREDFDSNNIKNLLTSAVGAANVVVYNAARDDESREGMGTTCVAAIVRDGVVHMVNVGDSRGYVFEHGCLNQVTTDHTVVRFLYEQGEIGEEEMRNHPLRNKITKAVGVVQSVDIDYFEISVSEGGVLLLCSDGLSNYCTNEVIAEYIGNYDADECADRLISHVIEQKGNDNITLALIKDL